MAEDYNIERLKLVHRLQGLVNGVDEETAVLFQDSLERIEAKIINLAVKSNETESLIRKRRYLNQQKKDIERVLNSSYKKVGEAIAERAVEVGIAAPEISKTILVKCLSGKLRATVQENFKAPEISAKRIKQYLNSSGWVPTIYK